MKHRLAKKTYRTGSCCFNAVVLMVACTGCTDNFKTNNESGPANEQVVLQSGTLTVESYQSASTTLATSHRRIAIPGDTIRLIAYVYDSALQTPVSSGTVDFSAEIIIDDGATIVEVPIGQVAIADGRAEIDWVTSTDFKGLYTVQASFAGAVGFSPSRWQFYVSIVRPNDEGATLYAMARLNHIVNLMKSPTMVDSEFEDGADQSLTDILQEEFNLTLVNNYSYYRLESGIVEDIRFPDSETYLSHGGLIRNKKVDLCVRTSLFVAANDDILAIVVRGTDGGPNGDVNDEGSPSEYPAYANDVAVHPGWAWMVTKLLNGFPDNTCDEDGDDSYPNDDFPGLRTIIETHRLNSSGDIRQLYITGHSLGGALVSMIAVKLANDPFRRGDRVYTFGAPWQGAYNKLFDFDDFKPYAERRTRNNGIRLFMAEGSLDPVPRITENTVREKWDEGLSSIWSRVGAALVSGGVKCAAEEVASWFGVGDGCDDIDRPIGYEKPSKFWRYFINSHKHRRLYLDGTPAIRLCTMGPQAQEVCNIARKTDCAVADRVVSCDPVYHSTSFGPAHWVGDYEFDARVQLRGDPTRYNFYFPESSNGSIRKPIEIVPLP